MDVAVAVPGSIDRRSGGYRYDRQLAAHLREQGDRVTVVPVPETSAPRQLLAGHTSAVVDRLDRPVDVLVQDALGHPTFWGANRFLEAPEAIVGVVHLLGAGSLPGPPGDWIERGFLAGTDGILCPSTDTAARVSARADVPTAVAHPAGRCEGAAVENVSAPGNPLRVAYVGSLVPRKGALTLVDALERLDGDWTATIVGSHTENPAYAERVRAAIVQSGLEGQVTLPGSVPEDQLRAVLAAADVLAVPSRRESFGIVYLEAMEWGTVPVATPVGGPTDLVSHGENGLLCPPERPDVLSAQLDGLVGEPDRYEELAAGSLATAANHPTWTESMATARRFLATARGA